MLDIGFRPDIEKILRRCPKERQTLLLSATVAPPVERLARTYMRDPEVMDFSPKTMTVDTIEQFYFTVDHERKFDLLVRLLEREQPRAGDRLLPHEARHRTRLSPAEQAFRQRRHDPRRPGAAGPRPRDEAVPRGRGENPGRHRRRRPRHRRDQHLAHHQLRHPAVVRRLRPPRRPHRPHGPRRRGLHVRHARKKAAS